MYRELITQLHTYILAIRILAKGYLSNTLITPMKLQKILSVVKRSLQVTNPYYTLVLDRLHLYYDMQLVTFGIDSNMNLVTQFLVFIQPYTQKPLILYQLETVPFPVLDQNTKAQSYTHLRIKKALYSFKFRNIHITQATRMKIMQEDRLQILLQGAFHCETQI